MDVKCESSGCNQIAEEAVNLRLEEAAVLTTEFDTALETRSAESGCEAESFKNLDIVSVTSTVCVEESTCNDITDTTSCTNPGEIEKVHTTFLFSLLNTKFDNFILPSFQARLAWKQMGVLEFFSVALVHRGPLLSHRNNQAQHPA